HMQRRKLLVAVAHCERLRRLDKAARPLGVFLNIHRSFPSACHSTPEAWIRHLHWVFHRVSARPRRHSSTSPPSSPTLTPAWGKCGNSRSETEGASSQIR